VEENFHNCYFSLYMAVFYGDYFCDIHLYFVQVNKRILAPIFLVMVY
jgi:hypothetical protein